MATEPDIPDFVRQRVRSAAQAAGSALSGLIIAGIVRALGVDAIPAELGDWLTFVLVPVISAALIVAYIVVIQYLARFAPWIETLGFGLKGTPRYVLPPDEGD